MKIKFIMIVVFWCAIYNTVRSEQKIVISSVKLFPNTLHNLNPSICKFNIEIENPEGVCQGVKEIFVNGEAIRGNLIPLSSMKAVNQVKVRLTNI